MSHVWQDQIQRWQRLAVWEAERLRSTPPDLSAAVAWMAQAWELAARCDPLEKPNCRRAFLRETRQRKGGVHSAVGIEHGRFEDQTFQFG